MQKEAGFQSQMLILYGPGHKSMGFLDTDQDSIDI